MKYFKLITRLEHADLNESSGKRKGKYWQNTLTVNDIDSCQRERLVEIFKPLVEENGTAFLDIVEEAL